VSSELVAGSQRSIVYVLAREHAWHLVVWTAMLVWSLALFAIVRADYLDFQLARFDLGNMVQAVWSTAHGRPLEMTDAGGEQIVRLASHVDPILVLLAPLWLLAPDPLLLAAVQVAACALGALPVFWLGRRHLGSERPAAVLALAYLAYPWLAWTAVDAFHPVTLAIPLFLYAIWFLDTARLGAFVVCGVLVLATGELMGFALAGLGLWYCLARGRRRFGLGTAVVGLSWTLLSLAVIVPASRGEGSPFYQRYESVGGSPQGIVETVFTDPGAIVSALSTRADLIYLLVLAAPLLGVFLLAPWLAAVALPQLLANGLSDWSTTTDPRHHYIAGLVPFLVAATVFGLTRVPATRRALVAATILVVSAIFAFASGPLRGAPGSTPTGFQTRLPHTHVEALRSAVSLVPAGVPVSATNRAGSHLSARRYVYSVPTVGQAEWLVVDTWNAWMPESKSRTEGPHPQLLRAFVSGVERSPSWRQVFERDGVLVFQRVVPL
jgi:uncharacterized membrane protein